MKNKSFFMSFLFFICKFNYFIMKNCIYYIKEYYFRKSKMNKIIYLSLLIIIFFSLILDIIYMLNQEEHKMPKYFLYKILLIITLIFEKIMGCSIFK